MSENHDQREQPEAEPAAAARRKGWWVLAAVLLLLYAAGVNEHWRVQRDSALYVGVGRSLAEGQGYTYNGRPHTLALPAFPLIVAAVFAVFGESYLALNIVTALIGLGCIAATWLLLRQMRAGQGDLVAALLLLGFSRQLYSYSAQALTEVPFTLCVVLALWAGQRMLDAEGREFWLWSLGAALLSVCATAVRPFGLALPVALVGALWLRRDGRREWKRSLGASALVVGLMALALGLWIHRCAQVHQPGDGTYVRALRGGDVGGTIVWMLSKVPQLLDALGETVMGVGTTAAGGVLLWVLVLVGVVRLVRQGQLAVPLFLVVYTGGVLIGQPGRRYLVPALPLILYALVIGAEMIADRLVRSTARRRRVLIVALVLVLLCNLVRIGKIVVENRSPDFYAAVEDGRWQTYQEAAEWLKANAEPDSVVMGYEARLVHLWTRLPVLELPYPAMPAQPEAVRELFRKGNVRYVILDRDKAASTLPVEKLIELHDDLAQVVYQEAGLRIFRVNADSLPPPGEQ